MADPIRVYLDSLKAYEEERLKARKLISLISEVANVVQFNLPDFLAFAYGLSLPPLARDRFRASDSPPQIDMAERRCDPSGIRRLARRLLEAARGVGPDLGRRPPRVEGSAGDAGDYLAFSLRHQMAIHSPSLKPNRSRSRPESFEKCGSSFVAWPS